MPICAGVQFANPWINLYVIVELRSALLKYNIASIKCAGIKFNATRKLAL
jgi:hypothetical protein